MYDVSDAAIAGKGAARSSRSSRRASSVGKVGAPDADAMLKASPSRPASWAKALDGAHFVIEASPERIDLKLALFADIERLAPAGAVIGSNTPR
jgi:3-hydroxyacyl-CoA dehydrogenase